MSPSTASARLLKDILWNFIEETDKNVCHKCGSTMSRSTFSIEHIIPWLDSDDPVGKFFDLKNITFSHFKCNVRAARRPNKKGCGTFGSYQRGCRCEICKAKQAAHSRKRYTPEKRRARYLAEGQ